MTLLQGLYAQNQRQLPADISLEFGSVWDAAVKDDNRERAFRALEAAALSGVHRALRNGSVWIEHSLAFRGRERLVDWYNAPSPIRVWAEKTPDEAYAWCCRRLTLARSNTWG